MGQLALLKELPLLMIKFMITNILNLAKLMRKNCSECGTEFSCDNSFSCWCSNFPKLTKEQIDDNDCICRECLLIRYRKKILDI